MIHEEIKTVIAEITANQSYERAANAAHYTRSSLRNLLARLPNSIVKLDQLLNAHGYRLTIVKK
jgi:hypothetical protein